MGLRGFNWLTTLLARTSSPVHQSCDSLHRWRFQCGSDQYRCVGGASEGTSSSNVFLTVLGYGSGNTNDVMMEQIADRGNGLYGFVDSRREAQRQMVKQLAGNLMTVAKDVKVKLSSIPIKYVPIA